MIGSTDPPTWTYSKPTAEHSGIVFIYCVKMIYKHFYTIYVVMLPEAACNEVFSTVSKAVRQQVSEMRRA